MKRPLASKFAAIALACAAATSCQASAQSGISREITVRHLAPDAMSLSDQAALENHRAELVAVARLYGYDLAAGNWSDEQTLCPPLPDTILLHYTQRFPDGTESLFTALVPRGPGHVRIVPVLYRNATPFVPAPQNPRNYALFNELAGEAAAPDENWLELSTCYVELTGGHVDLRSGQDEGIGIAGAPSARIHIEPKDKTARVTLATREGISAYRIWSISFNQHGRVTAASTEDQSVAAARVAHPVAPRETRRATQPQPIKEQMRSQPQSSSPIEQASDAPGWKYIPVAADPPSNIVSPAPLPPEKLISEPPNPGDQSDRKPQWKSHPEHQEKIAQKEKR
jgi:hypothetical protein